jgi:hypothetical protein
MLRSRPVLVHIPLGEEREVCEWRSPVSDQIPHACCNPWPRELERFVDSDRDNDICEPGGDLDTRLAESGRSRGRRVFNLRHRDPCRTKVAVH